MASQSLFATLRWLYHVNADFSVTVTVNERLTPSTEAVTFAVPGESALYAPPLPTIMTRSSLDVHFTLSCM